MSESAILSNKKILAAVIVVVLTIAGISTGIIFYIVLPDIIPQENNPPVIENFYPFTDPAIPETQSQEFNISASDVDGNFLNYSWYLNDSIVLGNFTIYTFTSDYSSSGIYEVRAEATDGEFICNHTWTITVFEILPHTVFSIDDMYWYKELVDDEHINHFFGSDDYLQCGRKNATYYYGHYGTAFRFPIIDRPSNWVKCEISFYIYQTTGYFNVSNWLLSVYEGIWNENLTYRGDYYWHLGNFNVSLNIGFNKIDITDYMIQPEAQTNETVSLTLYPYIKGDVWSDLDVMVYIYSKEANINESYLPQLIWS